MATTWSLWNQQPRQGVLCVRCIEHRVGRQRRQRRDRLVALGIIVSVTDFARGKELTKKDRALSDASARHVAACLRKVGLKGSDSVREVWVVGGPKDTGRRVSVVVVYPKR